MLCVDRLRDSHLGLYSLHVGSTFTINMQFHTVSGTGMGKIDLVILTVDGIPVGQNQLMEPQQPGTYNTKWSIQAKPDPNCDPTQQGCEMWEVGNYQANVGEWYNTKVR